MSATTPLLFLHSLGGRREFWDAVIAALPPDVRAIAPDLRGHGQARSAQHASFHLDDFADDALAAAAAATTTPVVMVGHSFGALVALAAAARAPGRIAALALVDAAGAMTAVPAEALEHFLAQAAGGSGAEFVAEAYRQNLERARPATRERVLASLADTDWPAVLGGYTALFGTDPLGLLARYPGPVRLIVDAANDSPMALHAQHPHLDVVPVEGTSHWINLDQPEALVKALVLTTHDAPSTTRPS